MPRVAIIGDGQLARMMHTEAIELGLQPRVLAGAPDASAAQVFGDVQLGDYTNFDDLHATIQDASAITFDHEHVPNEFLQRLLDEGYNVEPRPQALIYAQDKLEQRRKLKELGAPVPPFAKFDSVEDAREFWKLVDGQVCVKATRGGYDGHGVWFPETLQECEQLVTDLLEKGVVLYAEEKVQFARELSAMVARNRDGEVKAWPVAESRQADGVCHIAIAPAPELPATVAKQCRDLATKIATKLDVTGVLAVELFECIGEDGASKVLVNELAMRPHNTGHWTQDGCVTSQFEQHLRAVLNWPLGSVDTLEPVTVMVNTLGAEDDPQMPMERRVIEVMRRYPEAKVHLYGKGWRPGRKMGHVNVTGYDAMSTLAIAQHAAHFIVHANWY
ncbi:5-(carboxyamino)imidazole ribonucleotide synthase [Corynebacterium sp. NML130628]|uniref:5-(carboxyamino)imidazole ribonucleotide synthase n=1 Tax=Corynebacterium sp. NML130628 TaxID=1906333 RepID=UPI0008FB2B2F|nr:5-(carboxyamino)imidazole ribonucleotide synthase [Corynebacterium sp. NML130628]OIR40219.1 5-(carboxyamino)imidazole ribonucleotide synthase [Corynebacterium sp. NML130628]